MTLAERHSLTEEFPSLFRTSSYTPLIRAGVRLRKWSTNRKRHGYATRSNQHRVVETPGGKLVYRTTKKRASGSKCPVTGKRIQGIPHLRPAEYRRSRLPRNRRTVNGAYGEEQKIMKKVLKIQKAKERLAAKS